MGSDDVLFGATIGVMGTVLIVGLGAMLYDKAARSACAEVSGARSCEQKWVPVNDQ